ncbi:selenium cofactor biosynthesis protein YqeC [Romboutsia lituseburensis]|uniref:selenium cofactor biosynthesis protein YqeC n=1 Tax=Romboutsia lituseburensis TaxID=1537 RepID=UPI0022EA88A3|nr:selenium cofactor biosynthesis protein YqeC [Romboutsia lituseburensis]
MNNDIAKIFNIKKKDIITVIGAGGKTSFINYISKELRYECSVLLTTTTKIYMPNKDLYDRICLLQNVNNSDIYENKNGVTVIGKYINNENKIIGLDFNELKGLDQTFDLLLIEGDGSKRKKLKGWNENEPVVYNKTTKTIGILDITSYNMEISDENIHRLKKFKYLIDIKNINDKYINLDMLYQMILNKNGLFKNAIGDKILFINKVENKYYEDLSIQLAKKITKQNKDIKIYYGSIKLEVFKIFKDY